MPSVVNLVIQTSSAQTFHSRYDFLFVPNSFLFQSLLRRKFLDSLVSWCGLQHRTCVQTSPPGHYPISWPWSYPPPPPIRHNLSVMRIWSSGACAWHVTRVVMWGVTGAVWRCHVRTIRDTWRTWHQRLCNNSADLMPSLASSLWHTDMSLVTLTLLCGLDWSHGHCCHKYPWQKTVGPLINDLDYTELRRGDWWCRWCDVLWSGRVSRDITET